MKLPVDLMYTKDHEWIRIDNDIATIGITDFAQGELGDIVYVEIETLNQTLNAETVFGSVEAVKTVSDLFMPLSGEIIEINEALDDTPESVNDDPYGDGWMVRVKCSDLSQIEELLDAKAYKSIIAVKSYKGIYLDRNYWDYSVTTGKYRNLFLKGLPMTTIS